MFCWFFQISTWGPDGLILLNQKAQVETTMIRKSKKRNRSRKNRSLGLESLEDRQVMTTFMVTSTDAAGPNSLREVVHQANINPGADVIQFSESIDFETLSPMATISITDSVQIIGNGADRTIIDGGGTHQLFNVHNPRGAAIEVEFDGVTLQNGHSSTSDSFVGGGAIRSTEKLTIRDSHLTNNSANANGGAINQIGPSLSIENSTIANNEAGRWGGGIHASLGTGAEFTLLGSTISSNVAVHSGGGMYLGLPDDGQIDHSTIAQNRAGQGGGIDVMTGDLAISNTIIADNNDAEGTSPQLSSEGIVELHYSILSDNTGTAIAPSVGDAPNANGSFVGTSDAPINSGLLVLGDYGGPMPTHDLSSASPAVDAADPLLGGDWTVKDQRGAPRNVDYYFEDGWEVRRDIGAVESYRVGLAFEVTEAGDVVDGVFANSSLREAILGLEYDRTSSFIGDDPEVIYLRQNLHGETLELEHGELQVSEDVRIVGPGAARVTIESTTGDRVFNLIASPNHPAPDVTIEGVTLKGGNEILGGAILSNGVDLALDGVVITESQAIGGGAVYADGGTLSVTGSTFHENSALNGGAIYATNMDGIFPLNIGTSTFSGNSASQSGGAIVLNSSTTALIQRTTITENDARTTGGVELLSADAVLDTSIVSGNSGGTFRDARVSDGFIAPSYSLIGDVSGTGLSVSLAPDSDGNIVGSSFIYVGPSLEPLAMNGGQTPTHRPRPISRVIDAGEPGASRVDQRGVWVAVDGDMDSRSTVLEDMGAVEYLPNVPLTVDSALDVVDGNFSENNLSLREAAMVANYRPGNDSIGFADDIREIPLPGDAIEIFDSVSVSGPGADRLTIDSLGTDRIFTIDDGSFYSPIDVSIEGLTLTGGHVDSSGSGVGGAIYSRENLTLNGVRVTGNYANAAGGGVSANIGSLEIHDSTIDHNFTEGPGGGISTFTLLDDAIVELTNTTISSNKSFSSGGGIVVNSPIGIPTNLNHVTITGNVADEDQDGEGEGGGLHTYGSDVVLRNSIVAGNTQGRDSSDLFIEQFTGFDAEYSLIGTNHDTRLAESALDANGNIVGGPRRGPVDPQLDLLTDNGGPTPTHASSLGSPSVNAGDPAAITGVEISANDQRGESRVFDARTDMGAYELQVPRNHGDFNDDGFYRCNDIDALINEIAAGTHGSRFDLNHDSVVDLRDRNLWLEQAGRANLATANPIPVGDANLDGRVDAVDLNAVGLRWQDSNAGWCGGDFNADGVTNAVDLNALALNWQVDVAVPVAAAADPAAIGRTPRAALASSAPVVGAAEIQPPNLEVPSEPSRLRSARRGDQTTRRAAKGETALVDAVLQLETEWRIN